ncbi:hypothetical protein T11_16608, partial [Trichinella zimbabwensis]
LNHVAGQVCNPITESVAKKTRNHFSLFARCFDSCRANELSFHSLNIKDEWIQTWIQDDNVGTEIILEEVARKNE